MGTSPDRITPDDRQSPGIELDGLNIINQLGGGLLAEFARVIADVIDGLIDAAVNIGGTVVGVVDDVLSAVINLVKNIAGAVLGGGQRAQAVGLPDSFAPGELRDIADGQNELIGMVEALEDNAGYCNLTMSKDWSASGHKNRWMPVPFDAYVTAAKNADAHEADNSSDASGIGVMLFAPGVWTIDATVCVNPGPTSRQYFEAEIRVWRVWRADGFSGVTFDGEPYSVSRYSFHTDGGDYQTFPLFKPVLLKDFEPWYPVAEPVDQVGFKVQVVVRARDAESWTLVGGTLRSSLAVNRLSTDTADYAPPDEGDGTDVLDPVD